MGRITYGETPKNAPIRPGRIIFGYKRPKYEKVESEDSKKEEPKKKS